MDMIGVEELRALIDIMLSSKIDSMPMSDVVSNLASLKLAKSLRSVETSDNLDSFSSSGFDEGGVSDNISASFCEPVFDNGKLRIQTSIISNGTELD